MSEPGSGSAPRLISDEDKAAVLAAWNDLLSQEIHPICRLLSAATGINANRLSPILDSLENAGLIVRERISAPKPTDEQVKDVERMKVEIRREKLRQMAAMSGTGHGHEPKGDGSPRRGRDLRVSGRVQHIKVRD